MRLTAWYLVTLAAILALLGSGMFATITRRFDRELDSSLRDAALEVARVVRLRAPGTGSSARVFDATDLRIPDRTLYIADLSGRPVFGPPMESWIGELARRAGKEGPVGHAHGTESRGIDPERWIRAYAMPFTVTSGDTLVAVATADEVELEDRYASLIAAFGVAAAMAILLVAVGGWMLARQSTAPVERSIQHMRRFMADAAHELRTPLTVLRARAEVALQRPRGATDYVQALTSIERESVRLGQIVEDLLMLARADAGERPIDRQRVFLDDIALDAAEAARVIADLRSVRLEVDRFDEAAVDADPGLLRQLVIILLDNAIKFTPPNGVVRVGIQAGPTQATLTVADTGVGIPADQLPFVFDRFYRGDPARSRDGKGISISEGSGLGLSIARWIAEQHDADLTIESRAGQGTKASLTINLTAQGRPPL